MLKSSTSRLAIRARNPLARSFSAIVSTAIIPWAQLRVTIPCPSSGTAVWRGLPATADSIETGASMIASGRSQRKVPWLSTLSISSVARSSARARRVGTAISAYQTAPRSPSILGGDPGFHARKSARMSSCRAITSWARMAHPS